MSNVIDITKTHGMGTARVIEQFGIPRFVRKFVTDHIDWLTTKVYFDDPVDTTKLRRALSSLVQQTPFLRTRHVIDGDRDLLHFELHDPAYDYLAHGTSMLKVYVQHRTVVLTISHVVSDLKSCHLVGKDLETLYRGDALAPQDDELVVYQRFTEIFRDMTDISCKPSTWRFACIRIETSPDCFTKAQFLLDEMSRHDASQYEFEEIVNTAHLFKKPVRGCTTIATVLHELHIDRTKGDMENLCAVSRQLKDVARIHSDTFQSKRVYNFIKTENVFNSILMHILLSSSQLPSFVYESIHMFLPMKNDTTEFIKVVFQNRHFGSICFVMEFSRVRRANPCA